MQGESNVDFLRLPSTLTNPSCLIWRLAAFVPRSSPSSFFVKLTKPSVLYFYWKSKLAYDQYYKSFWSLENKFKVTWWTITSLATIVKIEKLATQPMKVIDHMIFTSDVSRQSEVYLFWGENVFDETTYTSSRKFFFFFFIVLLLLFCFFHFSTITLAHRFVCFAANIRKRNIFNFMLVQRNLPRWIPCFLSLG